jgi:hypothetical protein
MRTFFTTCLATFITVAASAQERKADTVKISLAKTSQVIFTIKDRSDLEILKRYNFQDLFQDVISRIEKMDTAVMERDTIPTKVARKENQDNGNNEQDNDRDDNDDNENNNDNDNEHHGHHWQHKNTSQSFNFDLGTNNYLSKGKFPENSVANYAVKPWGSWYVGMSSVQRSRLGKKFFLEWGMGVSWYNFKFQNDQVTLQKNSAGDQYDLVVDPRASDPIYDFKKSKLTATYINASLIPVFDFGGHRDKHRMWDGHSDSFRIGLGPYVGYRIGSYTKQVYTENGNDKKEHNKDNFNLNNLRYGARLQIGFRSTDLFFNYDLNNLFAANKGPNLNAFSFGVIF